MTATVVREGAEAQTTSGDNELNSMISQFVSPISDKVFLDYDVTAKTKKDEIDKKTKSKANNN